MKAKFLSAVILAICFSQSAIAQQEIPVNMYTGVPTIEIPITIVSHHDISVPVSMIYSANGVKLQQGAGWYGVGWNLNAGGSIQRTLKGLPDDFKGSGTDTRKGWLYTYSGSTSVASEVGSLPNSSDLSASTCTDEQTDNSKLTSWNDLIDTEPDVFTFNFGSYSGSFVFDNSNTPAIHFIPYKDFSISYTTVSAEDKKITSFKIITNDGISYTFAQAATASRSAQKNTAINSVGILAHDFNQYDASQFPGVYYNQEWKLTRIDSPSGAYVNFTYQGKSDSFSKNVTAGIYIRTLDNYKDVIPYTINEVVSQYYLTTISGSSGQQVDFQNSNQTLEKIIIKDARRGTGNEFVKEFLFSYSVYRIAFLKSITESAACERMPPYVFNYVGEGNMAYPSSSSTSKDAWGFYNGKDNGEDWSIIPKMYVYPDEPLTERFRLYPIPNYTGTEIMLKGANRLPDEIYMKMGTLSKIVYPLGGGALFEYEANRYFDVRANQDNLSGGLRIKSIAQFDGTNAAAVITKQFSYLHPVTGKSSGKLISRPTFILPAWQYNDPAAFNDNSKKILFNSSKPIADQYKLYTIRTVDDLSDQSDTQGSPVGYEFVTVSRIGAGKAVFQFEIPGTYAETSNGNWIATQGKFARPTACPDMGIVSQGGAWAYPFATNPLYDQQRGLLLNKTEYNETGAKVRYTENLYQFIYKSGTLPLLVWGVQYDKFANSTSSIFFFGKYFLLTDYDRVLSKETVTTYDAASVSKFNKEWSEYFYESTYHKLITRIKSTTSSGAEYTTKFKYAGDFGVIASNSDASLLAIKDLQETFRHATLIEQSSSAKPLNGTDNTTGASLVMLKDFYGTHKPLPQYSLSLSIGSTPSAFVPSSIQLVGSTYVFKPYSGYDTIQTILDYGAYNKPNSQIGLDRTPSSTVWGYGQTLPIAVVQNAGKGEFAFSDFETTTSDEFQLTNAFYSMPRTGSKGLHPYATLSKTVTKGTAGNFLLSFWLKNTAAVSFRVTIKNTALSTTYYDNTFTVTPGIDFTLYQKLIPVASAPTTFVVQLAGQSLALPAGSAGSFTPGLVPSIDDVSFYAENAQISSTTYTLPFGPSSATDPRGSSAYIDYDQLGREKYTYDKDRNITSRKSYSYNQSVSNYLKATFSVPEDLFTNVPLTFTAVDNSCFAGVTYEWTVHRESDNPANDLHYGPTTNIQYAPVLTTAGMYVVALVVRYGAQTANVQRPLTITAKPIPVSVCANGTFLYNCPAGTQEYRQTTCSQFPTPSTGTSFYVTVGETLSGLTYSWKKKYVGAQPENDWFDVGTNTNSYTTGTTPGSSHTGSFQIKCVVTSSDGRSGSAFVFIDVIACTPQ